MAVRSDTLLKLFVFLLYYAVLTVGQPSISINVSNPVHFIGGKVVLSCIYSPQTNVLSFASIKWHRNGTLMAKFTCPDNATHSDMCVLDYMGDGRLSLEADVHFSGNLTISKLQASDSGIYNCSVVTQSGTGISSTKLTVKTPGHPKLSDLHDLREGRTKNITCSAIGLPDYEEPAIYWNLNQRNISSNVWNVSERQDSQHAVSITSTLRFFPTYRDHKALLRCELRMKSTGAKETQERLNVLYAPKDVTITQAPQETMATVTTGRQINVTLVCEWRGNPRGEAAWLFRGKPLDGNNIIFKTTSTRTIVTASPTNDQTITMATNDEDSDEGSSSLTILNVKPSDHGGYQCNVTSYLGNDVAYFNLTTSYPPHPPVNFIVIPSMTTSSSLHVVWRRSQGVTESDSYIIHYCDIIVNETDKCATLTGIFGQSKTIDDLSAFTWYYLSILSTNDAGNSREVNTNASTAPLSPAQYGIKVDVDQATDNVTLFSESRSRENPVPDEVCFLVRASGEDLACPTEKPETCVIVNSTVKIQNFSEIHSLSIVSYGRDLCSYSSTYEIVKAQQRKSLFTSITFISAVAVGGSLVIILLVISIIYIVMCVGKRTHKKESTPELTQVQELTTYRRVDDDGLVYIDVSHDVSRPKNAPPIQTESPTIYANINSDTLRKKRDVSHGSVRTGNESTNGSGQSDGRTTDSDGLIYIDISHNKDRSLSNTKPIRTEEETIYADLKPDAMRGGVGATSRSDEHGGNHPKGEDLLYIDLSHDNTHPSRPRDNPIRTEEQTIYADLNPEAMKLQKEERQKSKTTDGNRASEMDGSNVGSVTSDGANLNYSSSDSTRVDVVDKSAVRLRHLYIC